jgi:hypothetical protein
VNVTLLIWRPLETARLDSTEATASRPIQSFLRTRSVRPSLSTIHPDPSFHFIAYPDPDPILLFNASHQSKANLRPYWPTDSPGSILSLHASIVSVHGPPVPICISGSNFSGSGSATKRNADACGSGAATQIYSIIQTQYILELPVGYTDRCSSFGCLIQCLHDRILRNTECRNLSHCGISYI